VGGDQAAHVVEGEDRSGAAKGSRIDGDRIAELSDLRHAVDHGKPPPLADIDLNQVAYVEARPALAVDGSPGNVEIAIEVERAGGVDRAGGIDRVNGVAGVESGARAHRNRSRAVGGGAQGQSG